MMDASGADLETDQMSHVSGARETRVVCKMAMRYYKEGHARGGGNLIPEYGVYFEGS